MSNVCEQEDDYVRSLQEDRATPVWEAWFSLAGDPRLHRALMDDDRPGVQPRSAWLRLAAHLRDRGGRLEGLSVKFRSNRVEPFPRHQLGYFFCKSVARTDAMSASLSFYLLGVLTPSGLVVQRWKIPELILIDQGPRPLTDTPCLITNPGAM